jgi:ABC-type transporter MlaC component
MKHTNEYFRALSVLFVTFMFAGLLCPNLAAQTTITDKMVRKPATKQERRLQDAFSKRVKQYVAVRENVRKQLTPLSKDSTPEQIEAYQKNFVTALRTARTFAKPGYIFTRDTADYFRTLMKAEFKGTDRAELREMILEADTAGVPMRVNYPYPETKELTQIPPTLLLTLPQLPKEVRYRFVARNLLLVDTDNGLIVDYMLKALP